MLSYYSPRIAFLSLSPLMQVNKPRLQAVESLVPNGARLLDIGTDHGLLPLLLLARGEIKSAFLSDVNKGPLAACRRQALAICPKKLDKVRFAISDGFKAIPRDAYSFATICGMGGELIAKIIEEGGDKAKLAMVLQPMSHHEKLREYLWNSGYVIKKELYVAEGKHVYLIMHVWYKGNKIKYKPTDPYLGKSRPKTAVYSAYANRVLHAAKKRLAGYKLEGNTQGIDFTEQLIKEAQACLLYSG